MAGVGAQDGRANPSWRRGGKPVQRPAFVPGRVGLFRGSGTATVHRHCLATSTVRESSSGLTTAMEHGVSPAWLAPRRAWLAWGVLWLLFAAEGLLARPPSVGRVYRESARQWWTQQPLYNQIGKGFLYLPHAAVLQTPFAALPEGGAEVAWRTLTIGLFALGIHRLAKLATPGGGGSEFGWMTLVAIPLGFSAARNGQAQLIVAGLAMLTAEALCRRQWNRAAACLWIGLAFKPVMLPFVLVAAALHAPLRGRLALGGVLFALFPYLGQSLGYVKIGRAHV